MVGVKASARVPTRFLHVYHHSHLWTYRGVSMMLGGAASDTTAGSSRQATSSAPQHTAAAAATSGSTTEDLGLHSAQVLHAYWVKCHDLRAAI